jgi:hypothetical protein
MDSSNFFVKGVCLIMIMANLYAFHRNGGFNPDHVLAANLLGVITSGLTFLYIKLREEIHEILSDGIARISERFMRRLRLAEERPRENGAGNEQDN